MYITNTKGHVYSVCCKTGTAALGSPNITSFCKTKASQLQQNAKGHIMEATPISLVIIVRKDPYMKIPFSIYFITRLPTICIHIKTLNMTINPRSSDLLAHDLSSAVSKNEERSSNIFYLY